MIEGAETPKMSSVTSSVPETHLLRDNMVSSQSFTTRINQKGKLFVSVFDDSPKLEWKISCTHANTNRFIDALSGPVLKRFLYTTLFISQPEGHPLDGKTVTNIIDGFLSKEPCCNQPIIVSSFYISLVDSSRFDLVNHENLENSSQPSRVRVASVIHYEKLMRRIFHFNASKPAGALIIEAVSKSDSSRSRRSVVVSHASPALVSILSNVANVRSLMKRGNPPQFKTFLDRLLSQYLNNGSHLIMLVIEPPKSFPGLEVYEKLFDALERMSLTALPASSLPADIRVQYESVDQLPNEPVRDRPTTITTPSSESSHQAVSDQECEIADLRAKNLQLKHELDKYRLGGAVGGSAYSSHLVNEVKRLRAELETMETEKRKYATSRRLIDSLVDKSNKLSSELESRSERIDKLLLNEKILKTELGNFRDHCQYLVAQNRELELGYPTESKPANVSEPPQRVDSLYKQFLFPFRGKNELEGKLKKLTDHLAKIGQKTNCGHSPILEIDRANKTVDDIRGRILDLVSASEKLEISAYCLIKNQEFVGG